MNTQLNKSSSFDETVPVLVAGGSLVGLSFSLFLDRQGIKAIGRRAPSGNVYSPARFKPNCPNDGNIPFGRDRGGDSP